MHWFVDFILLAVLLRYLQIISSGLTTLPSDLLILVPSLSTIP